MTDDKGLHPYVDTGLGGKLYVNPGSGPVDNSTEDNANKNIEQLVKDVGLEGMTSKRDQTKDYSEGRFAYQLNYKQKDVEVQMPGSNLEKVRFLDVKEQNPWNFHRLYVDGQSWLWKYAVDIIKGLYESSQSEGE